MTVASFPIPFAIGETVWCAHTDCEPTKEGEEIENT